MCHAAVPPGSPTPEVAPSEVEITLPGGEPMPALHTAAGPGAPGVLIVADVFGRSPFYEHLAALVAEAGFQALVPEFFFRQGGLAEPGREAAFARRARLDEGRSVEDLRAAVAWLRERSGGSAIGTIGFCMGGTFVLDLASTEPDLVTVAYYGFPVPAATLPAPPPRPIDLVQSLRGPVLAFWGDEDEAVGMENVAGYVERVQAANPHFAHEIVGGLGHGFLGSADLSNAADPGGATWQRTLAHLREHLTIQKEG